MNKGVIYCIGLGLVIVVLFVLNLLLGSVSIPAGEVMRILAGGEAAKGSWRFIVLESRLPQAITATLCGAALAVSGLLLQTAFRNPLAGPSVFGINSGAGLGVALVMLLFGGGLSVGSLQLSGFAAILLAAFIGAMAVMAVIFFFSTLVRNSVMLLIIGIMIGYLSNSAISLLNFFATDEGVKSYLVWGMGSFGGVSLKNLPVFVTVTLAGIVGPTCICDGHSGRHRRGTSIDKAVECLDAWRPLCGEPRGEHPAGAQLVAHRYGHLDGCHHGLLWTSGFYRTGGTSYCPAVAHNRQPSTVAACHTTLWRGGCTLL